jgi:hypothetical protein
VEVLIYTPGRLDTLKADISGHFKLNIKMRVIGSTEIALLLTHPGYWFSGYFINFKKMVKKIDPLIRIVCIKICPQISVKCISGMVNNVH